MRGASVPATEAAYKTREVKSRVRAGFWRTRFSRSSGRQRVENPPLDPVREPGARPADTRFTPARSSPPCIAMRPRVAARSPRSGASLPATTAPSASSTSGRVPRRVGRSAFARLELERITRSSRRRAHRHLPSRCAPRVAARLPRVRSGRCSVARRRPLRYARLEPGRISPSSHRRAHRHLPSRCTRALRRARRRAVHRCRRRRRAGASNRACPSLAASFAVGVPMWNVGGRYGGGVLGDGF